MYYLKEALRRDTIGFPKRKMYKLTKAVNDEKIFTNNDKNRVFMYYLKLMCLNLNSIIICV